MPDSIDEILTESIKNGWLTTGPVVQTFESMLKKYFDSENVILVNSCTAALHLAIAAKGFNKNDKFIAPTYTFVATVEAGEYLGMKPVLVDSDDNYNLDLNQVEDSLINNGKIKCILPVHFGGRPVDMVELSFLSDKYGVMIIEDAAHAFETISNNGKVGKTNDAACFSFYANKNITTFGEGGAISTNDSEYANIIRKLSLHGMSRDGWKRFSKGGKWFYDISDLGYKYNLTDIAAAFGIWQLKHINDWLQKRCDIVDFYMKKFQNISGISFPPLANDVTHANHLFVVSIEPDKWTIDRDQIISDLNERGIGTSVHYIPIHMHSYYKSKYGYGENDFQNSKRLYERAITLPLYPSLTKNELQYIADIFLELWLKNKKD